MHDAGIELLHERELVIGMRTAMQHHSVGLHIERFTAAWPIRRVGVWMQVSVDPKSNRLQLLEPFNNWSGSDITGAQVRLQHAADTMCSFAPTTAVFTPLANIIRRLGLLSSVLALAGGSAGLQLAKVEQAAHCRVRAGADQGQGQVHDRPHLHGGPLAQVPRPPGQHQQQHAHRRHQRGE